MAATKVRDDTLAKQALRSWPLVPGKLWAASEEGAIWLRAQPPDGVTTGPRLVATGATAFATQPDGMWVSISPSLKFADVMAVEVCGSAQNFADKRSRYAPSTSSTVLEVFAAWLGASVRTRSGGTCPRWKTVGLRTAPMEDLMLPLRVLRVLYFLKNGLYQAWTASHVPGPHEFVAPFSSVNSYHSQKMQLFLKGMTLHRHFYLQR